MGIREKPIRRATKQFKLFIPNATVFVAGACVMIVEIVATRIIARYVGASIYTWTSVIGVVLTGVALGNYFGGRLADRYRPKKTISILFILSSASCALITPLNNMVGNTSILLHLSWLLRTTVHVSIIFFLPSLMLGMISPVVAKYALEQGAGTGRTIGNIYASSVAGSIVGTFLTGFVLIAYIGTNVVPWIVAGILGLMGLLYGAKNRLPYVWATVFAVTLFFGFGNSGFALSIGQRLALREEYDPGIIYSCESQYSHIRIEEVENLPGIRWFVLDQLVNSVMRFDGEDLKENANLYRYQTAGIEIYESACAYLKKTKKDLRVLVMGGGGYVVPRYMEANWPGSRIDVVEIDPAVTEAAILAFGLPEDTPLGIHHLDARNHVDNILRRKNDGKKIEEFDFIYGDVISGLTIPYQLTTYEFNEKIRSLLSPDGVYIVNVLDSMRFGKFAGAVINTMQRTFKHVYVFPAPQSGISTLVNNVFIVIGSGREIDFTELINDGFDSSLLTDPEMQLIGDRVGGLVLTDDYAPVDSLISPVVRHYVQHLACVKLSNYGNGLMQQGRLNAAIDYYKRAIGANPDFAETHNNLANALAQRGKFEEAIGHYHNALWLKPEFPEAQSNLAAVLAQEENFSDAIMYYEMALKANPDFVAAHAGIGNVMLSQGRFDEALTHYRRALELTPQNAMIHNNVGTILTRQGKINSAIEHYREAVLLDPGYGKAKQNLDILLSKLDELKKEGTGE
ncbi:MAG: fused MFS/spermidine synthase [Candidatus Omnitrophota bacterium]